MSSIAMTKSLKRIAEISRQDGRFKVDAYLFVQQSLAFAQLQRGQTQTGQSHGRGAQSEKESGSAASLDPHLTGQELCAAIKVYAQELFGLMAKLVLNSWGVTTTGDFGEIVYQLIDIGEMTKSEHDQREDFEDVFEFTEAFQRDYLIQVVEES